MNNENIVATVGSINITEAVELAAATIRQKERVRQLKIFNAALRRGDDSGFIS